MNSGIVAERSGVAPGTIRCHEAIGLIVAADRLPNGYRGYSALDMRTPNFIADLVKRSRGDARPDCPILDDLGDTNARRGNDGTRRP